MREGCTVFIDGSKMDVGTVAGIYIEERNTRKSYRIPDESIVFQADILAIVKGTSNISTSS